MRWRLTKNRAETRLNDARDARTGNLTRFSASHTTVCVPHVYVDAVIDDGHLFELTRGALKGVPCYRAEARLAPNGLRQERSGEFGVSELIFCDALQDATHLGIGSPAELLGREQGPEGLSDTALGNRELDHIGKGHGRKAVGNHQLGRTHLASTVTAREREAGSRVPHFVERRPLRPDRELGRCSH